MKKKKVCIISTVHSVFDIRIFRKQAKTLAEAGYDVTFIVEHYKQEIIDEIKIIPLTKHKNRVARIFVSTFKALLSALKEKADIYHIHDPELYFVGACLKLLTNKKVIHDNHEHYEKDILGKLWIPENYRKIYLFFFKIYEKLCIPFLDAIIYVVPDIKERFKNFKGPLIEIRNYPNKIKEEDINFENKEWNKVVFWGGVTEIRGISELIQAFHIVTKEIPDATLDIVGDVYPLSYKENLLSLISEYNLEKNINLIKFVPFPELKEIAEKSSIGIVTYLPVSENNVIGLPNKILEYMVYKLAVVASDFPLYKEIIEESQCGFTVNPGLPEDIAKKIIILMQNQELCKQFAESGYKDVMEKYNWEVESIKLLNLYKELLY
jgi:glycosyltransferase involved in cell wall biosynthesis